VRESDHFEHFLWLQWQNFNSLLSAHYQSMAAIQQLSATVATSKFVLTAHYDVSKEYLTNSHVLSKYFELVFLQLHPVKFYVNWSSFK